MFIKEKMPLIFGLPSEVFLDSLKEKRVFVAELRPDLLGMKPLAEELLKKRIQPVVICDNMVAFCMERGLVSAAHIFCEAKNEKTGLCRTGSLIVALCAQYHHIPVYLHQARAAKNKQSSLLKIAGMKVTAQNIKTYVPFLEEVPLELVYG